MAEYKWRVDIIESERGWGQKIEEVKFWPENEYDKALAFVKEYNAENNLPYTPDWVHVR